MKTIHHKSAAATPSPDWEIPPLLKRVFGHRGIATAADIDYSLHHLHSPDTLQHGTLASELIVAAMAAGQRILILGDYDADGATACCLAVAGLTAMGAQHVDYLVPNRFEYGYGLSAKIAEVAVERAPDLLITVDNGINSIDGVARLKQADITVIITDHHLAGAQLPAADAIVNPNQPGCNFPSKNLAGVGVMFYVLLLVRARLKQAGWFTQCGIDLPNLAQFLDLVALGTVADLVPLDHNNRILVAQGVARIRTGQARPGIKALLQVAGRDYQHCIAADFGFVLAPRLNAAGRLDDISTGIDCLLADDPAIAAEYATALNAINRQRRHIETTMQTQAQTLTDALLAANPTVPTTALCLYDPSWHLGLTGLIAARIKDKNEIPVIAFADNSNARGKAHGKGCGDNDEAFITGSGRSIPGLHLKNLLETLTAVQPNLLIKFGGHAMAAGLTIARDNFDLFADIFTTLVAEQLGQLPVRHALYTDGVLAETDRTFANAELLRTAAPWGQGFPPPIFDGTFEVKQWRIVGNQHVKMRLLADDGGSVLDAIAFRAATPDCPPPSRIHAVFQLSVNEFYQRRAVQLIIDYFHPLD